MASEPPPAEEVTVVRRRAPAVTVAKWAGLALIVLLILGAAFVAWLNTDAGRRFVVRQINAIEMASGLQVGVERIDGSIFGSMTLHGLTLSDPQGVFFQAPSAEVDYRPLAYLRNHIDIRSLVVPQARLARLPELRPGDPDAPMLPDIDIDIGRLAVGRLVVDPAVTGRPHILSIDSRARIADGRAELGLDLGALAAEGVPGGDRLSLRLDAVPADNRLDIAMAARGPAGGFLAGLAGLDEDIVAHVEGRGDWTNWQGRARAALGGELLANLDLTARDGTFALRGPLRPGLLMEGPVEQLFGPVTRIDVTTTLDERRADLRLRLGSSALAVAAEGLVDLGQNRFEGMRVAARLLRPGAIAPNLSGRDAQIALLLNGPFATPSIAYELRAASLSFDDTIVEGLRAVGGARVNADDIIVPISARAARIRGFDAVAGGTIANVTLNGDLGITGPRIVSDNLRVRADRIDARLAIAFDLAEGRYLAAIQGRVNNYLVDGVGLFDITTDVELTSSPAGFGLGGRIAARSRRIDNQTVADLLGGPATMSANVAMEPSGLIRLSNVRLASPLLRVNSGGGTYRSDGALDLRLSGVSESYGALDVRISGTASAPEIRLAAASPGFGVGLRDVEATVRATAQGWALQATGESAYGPFSADVVILSNEGPLTIAVNRLTFAGVDFAGRLVQSAAGPFVGTLTLAGSGLDGSVRLSAEGSHQRIDIAATANGARTPGDVPILIQRGVINATAILYPDAPAITGDAQLAGLTSGDLSVQRARVRIDYRGGSGTAQVLAEGRRGVAFRVAVNAALAPDVIRLAMQGEVNAAPFRFAQPAQIRREGSTWRLAPVTVALSQGQVRLAGSYGDGLVVQARLDRFDLAMLNAFSPGLGIGGSATGSLDFSQPSNAAFPRAELRINVQNFTRTGIATRSVPVNMALAGSLRPDAASLAGVIRRGGNIVGRVQARLQPSGSGSWTEQLAAAGLNGGIRYNGPADVPMSFANLAGHQLTGGLVIAADFRGNVADPRFFGLVRADNLTYVNEEYGTRITNLALEGRFNASQLQIVRLNGRAGDGTVSASGNIGLAAAAGFPIDLQLRFDNAQLARSNDLGARATGAIRITNGPQQGARIAGEMELGEVRYEFVRQAAGEVRELAGVRRRGDPIRPPNEQQADAGVPSIWQLDLRVHADNRVYVSGMGLESEWSADLRVRGTSATPEITGNLEMIRGTLSLAGRRFDLQRGHVAFDGSRPPNPRLDIEATSDIDDVEVAINISGAAYNPQIAFTSTPNLPQDEVVSRILFGRSVTEISALQAVQLAASLNTLRGSGGGLNPLGQLRSATGIDRIRILGADDTTGRGTAVAAGMYLSDDIYVEIVTDAKGFTATQVEISLSRALSMLSQFGSNSGTNVNLRYRRDY